MYQFEFMQKNDKMLRFLKSRICFVNKISSERKILSEMNIGFMKTLDRIYTFPKPENLKNI